MTKTNMRIVSAASLFTALALVGCAGNDERLEKLVHHSLEQQAAQNVQMARLQQDLTSGTRELIEADAKARAEFATLQGKLQAEQATVGTQRDLLELERKGLASERRRDQLLVAAMEQGGLLLACLTPLLLAAYVVYLASRPVGDAEVAELLVQEFTSAHPLLLPALAPHALPRPPATPAGGPLA